MNERMRNELKTVLGRVAAIFFVLWVVAMVTGLLGGYDYAGRFLQIAIVLFLLSRIIAAFKDSYLPGEKLKNLFANVGWALLGLWIVFTVLYWIDVFGIIYVGFSIDSLFVVGVFCLLTGGVLYALYELFVAGHPSGENLKKYFSKVGWVLVGLWAAFKVLYWVDFYIEVGMNINYVLVVGIMCLIGSGILYALCEMKPSVGRKSTPFKSVTPVMIPCPHCGGNVEDTWVLCPHCGASLGGDTQVYDEGTRIY